MLHFKYLILVLTLTLKICNADIDRVDDNDLMHLLTQEENVVVVFSKSNCPKCEELEKVAETAKDKFKEYLSATLVKAHDSQLLPIYNPNKEASLIYFRKGIPLLYHGELSEEEILMTFSENKEPAVKELTDESFEFLTQASTGSTTGDWFIFFTSNDCHSCHRLYAVWEAVGSKLKHRLNVARMNRHATGAATARRFGITKSPYFLFMRHGKFYRYKKDDYSPKSLIAFAEGGYVNEVASDVPQIPSLFNDYLEKYAKIAGDHQSTLRYGVLFIALLTIVTFFTKYLANRKAKAKIDKAKKSG